MAGFVSIRSSGPNLEDLTNDTVRGLQQAQRKAGREVARIGRRAILDSARRSRGSLRMMGRRLGVKSDVTASGTRAEVSLSAKPAGPWAIVDSGAGSHTIRPTKAKALTVDGGFAAVVNHPGIRGTRAWTGAEADLDRAILPELTDIYDEALDV